MRKTWDSLVLRGFLVVVCALGFVALTGCEDDNEAPFDYGDNDPNLYVSMGDSITLGIEPFSGTPYPDQLAGMLGKTVLNYGVDGAFSYEGAGSVGHVLANTRTGHLLIMYGANDLIWGASSAEIVGNLRTMVQAAKANKTKAVVATLPAMTRHAMHFYDATLALNTQIRQMAAEENIRVAETEPVFLGREEALLPDGLHPNNEGNRLIAEAFRNAL